MDGDVLSKRHPPQTSPERFASQRPDLPWVKVLPGQVYVTTKHEMITTGLGSCVAACMWDEQAGVGGMNHFLLPFDNIAELNHWRAEELLSNASRYGCYAMEQLINRLLNHGAQRCRLSVKLFGGAQLMGFKSLIGIKNVEFVLGYVQRERLNVVAKDLGGVDPRRLLFDPKTGRAWLKRIPCAEMLRIRRREECYSGQLDLSGQDTADSVELFE